MKAVVLKQFGGVENFSLEDVPSPRLTEGGVRVRIRAAAFNPIDYQMRRGGTESKLLKSPVLGREFAGEVAEVAAGVDNFRPGDEVFGYASNLGSNGTYAEEIVLPKEIVARKPANLAFGEAAAVPLVGLTAWQAVKRCPVGETDKVFVAGGAGGVGSMLIRLLTTDSARRVFTTAGNEDSRRFLLELGLGAERILDYRDANLTESLLRAANGEMDFCFDTVGGAMSEISAAVIKVAGVYADITFLATDAARELLFDKACTVVNISNYAYGLDGPNRDLAYYGDALGRLCGLLETGALSPTPIEIVGGLSAETAARAHEMLENNLARGRKLVMEVV